MQPMRKGKYRSVKQGDSWKPGSQNTEIKEAEKISDRNFTRSTCRASTNEHYKSAITDQVPVRTMIYYELGSK